MVIPPSIMLILYGSEAGTSISSLFAASLIPGVLLGLAYAVYIAVRCKIDPSMGPSIPYEEVTVYPEATLENASYIHNSNLYSYFSCSWKYHDRYSSSKRSG